MVSRHMQMYMLTVALTILWDLYVPAESDTCINAVSQEQYDEGCIWSNADLESRLPIRSMEQLKHMYPKWLGDIDKLKNLNSLISSLD